MLINPFGVHASGLVHPVHYYGKREAQVLDPATNLVTYPNGAVAPFDPNVAAATAYHYSAKAASGYYPFVGAANVHPAGGVVYGRKKREAQVPVSLVTGYAHTPYLGGFFGHVAAVVAPFTAHPNGALVPAEPADVVEARAAHLAAGARQPRHRPHCHFLHRRLSLRLPRPPRCHCPCHLPIHCSPQRCPRPRGARRCCRGSCCPPRGFGRRQQVEREQFEFSGRHDLKSWISAQKINDYYLVQKK